MPISVISNNLHFSFKNNYNNHNSNNNRNASNNIHNRNNICIYALVLNDMSI